MEIYLCQHEGINGLCSVRDPDELRTSLSACAPELAGVKLNEALEEGSAFLERKLHVRWRKTLVNCGLKNEPGLDAILNRSAQRLSPAEWNEELGNEDAVLIDARNIYEAEVGRMHGVRAREVGRGAERFRDQVDQIVSELDSSAARNKRILMFCTSGIRCEKLGAILKTRGFENVGQLDGGVTKLQNYLKKGY